VSTVRTSCKGVLRIRTHTSSGTGNGLVGHISGYEGLKQRGADKKRRLSTDPRKPENVFCGHGRLGLGTLLSYALLGGRTTSLRYTLAAACSPDLGGRRGGLLKG